MHDLRIGISGWNYPGWRKVFYPPKLPQRRELEYAGRQFNSIEINGSFYSLQRPESYRAWYEATPPGFLFSVKGGRFITHMKKLNGVDEALANFFASGVLCLEEKLGPILWQFPPNLGFLRERFERFLELLPRDTEQAARLARRHSAKLKGRAATEARAKRPLRHAFEIRHESFRCREFTDLLSRYDAALVVADTAGKWPYIEEACSDFAYARLHGGSELYVSGYEDAALDLWAAKIRKWRRARDVYVYFDNDAKVCAPFDAMALAAKLGLRSEAPEFRSAA